MKPERAAAEEAEAQEYANLIRDGEWHDWPIVNRSIVSRFSRTALIRIKRRAWQIVESQP